MHFGYSGANVCMTDLPFLAAQASDEVGDRFIDFVGHIFLHVETRVDRHLGLVFEHVGKVGRGTRKAVASGDVDEQLWGTGFLQLVRIDLHQGCVLRRLTIERNIVGHDNAGQAGLTGPADRLGIDGFSILLRLRRMPRSNRITPVKKLSPVVALVPSRLGNV